MGFEHQEPSTNLGFCRELPRPQQIGVRLKPEEKKAEPRADKRRAEPHTFQAAPQSAPR